MARKVGLKTRTVQYCTVLYSTVVQYCTVHTVVLLLYSKILIRRLALRSAARPLGGGARLELASRAASLWEKF